MQKKAMLMRPQTMPVQQKMRQSLLQTQWNMPKTHTA
jgi:hypothetical protein